MDTYALVDGSGTIVNRIVASAEWTPPTGLLVMAEADTFYEIGGTYRDGVYTPPPRPEPPPLDLLAYAAQRRWQKEVGGIVVNGVPIATDDRSKTMIIGSRLAADADPNWSAQWVANDGHVYPINAAAIIAISDAVQAHVNACFTTFVAVKADIDSGVITTTEQIDAAFA